MTTDEVTQLIAQFGRPHFMPVYLKDFFTDRLVRAMELEELGAYWKLNDVAWNESPANTVPGDDDKAMALLLGIPVPRWRKLKGKVLACFVRQEDGRWLQKRQREVMIEVLKRQNANRDRTSAAAEARRRNVNRNDARSVVLEPTVTNASEHSLRAPSQSQSQIRRDPPTPLEESGGEDSQGVKDLGNRLAAGKTLAGFPVFDVFRQEAQRLNSDWKETDILRLFHLGQSKPIKSWKAWLNQCAANAKKPGKN